MNPNDLNSLTELAAKQKAGTQNLLGGQDVQTSDFLKKFQNFLGGQETTSAMAGRIGQELGLPQLQKTASNLNQALYDVPGVYSKATQGFDVNSNQLARLQGAKYAELAPLAQRATSQAQEAGSQVATRMGYETTDRERAMLPYQTEQDFLKDRFARETTLYSQGNQNELDALINKLQMGVTLSEGEKNRANQLSMQEKEYQQAKETQGANTQIIDVGGQKYLIDTQTGKIISKYGATGGTSKPASSYFGSSVQTNPNNNLSMQSVPSYFVPS
jgi:hypothetical protein